MKTANYVKPVLQVLNTGQIERVHEYSLRILASTGVRVDSNRARGILTKAIGRTTTSRSIDQGAVAHNSEGYVRIPRELVEWALNAAPSSIEVYDRAGNPAFGLPGPARFGIGVTALYYQDPISDEVLPFTRKDMGTSVRLGSFLSSFDAISTVGVLQDVPPQTSDLYATLEMTASTHKPLVLLVSDDGAFGSVLDLLEHLHGDLASRPSIIPYLNPITPLVINRGTVNKMWAAIDRGLPFIYSNYGMAGASAPINPASTLVLLNAELLAGLTLSQLIKEGTPIVLGSLPAYFDMKGMGSFYDPHSYLVSLSSAEMMAYYGLPHAGTSGSGVGWAADLIIAGHQWFNHLVSCIGKVGLAPFVGDLLGSKAFSPTVIVYANEVIEQARLFAQGFALDDSAVTLDEIAEVGPGGNFLLSESTLESFRQAYYRSSIFPYYQLEGWQANGSPRADTVLRHYTRDLLDRLQAPEYHGDLVARGQAFIQRLENTR